MKDFLKDCIPRCIVKLGKAVLWNKRFIRMPPVWHWCHPHISQNIEKIARITPVWHQCHTGVTPVSILTCCIGVTPVSHRCDTGVTPNRKNYNYNNNCSASDCNSQELSLRMSNKRGMAGIPNAKRKKKDPKAELEDYFEVAEKTFRKKHSLVACSKTLISQKCIAKNKIHWKWYLVWHRCHTGVTPVSHQTLYKK